MGVPELNLPSPAKINRFLHVVGRREDGFHLLQTLFQFLDQGDQMTFTAHPGNTLRRVDRHPFALPDVDLSLRAASLLRDAVGRSDLGATITLEKNIPPGSGLGGGSSNAATTLLALNRLWNLNLDVDELIRIGGRLGADVPIFIHGEAAWAEGTGDELSACPVDEPWLALLIPPVPVSTAEAFDEPALPRSHEPVSAADFSAGHTGNDLEAVTFHRHPEVALAHDYLNRHGPARMSGSGGAVFVPLASRQAAERVLAHAPRDHLRLCARACNLSPLALSLDSG